MKRNAKRTRGFPLMGVSAVVMLIGVYFIWRQPPLMERPKPSGMTGSSAQTPLISETQGIEGGIHATLNSTNEDAPVFTVTVYISEITDTRYLELVNLEYPISGEPDNKLIVSAWPAVPVRARDIPLHKTALEAVGDLFAAARETYAGTFFVTSGYRDYEAQRRVYNNAADKSFVQPPGHSEHQTGLAADILIIGIGMHDMAGSREARWLAENAWKYGLILRYAKDKQNITGIAAEPWHFRYIGQPHAWFCQQNNLCFEEYIQFLKESDGYQATLDGKTYSVLYQTPQNGIIYVPEHLSYQISGDNTGGFIVTAWS